MSQGPPNPGFMQEKVKKGNFLKKGSREFFFFFFQVSMNLSKAWNTKLEANSQCDLSRIHLAVSIFTDIVTSCFQLCVCILLLARTFRYGQMKQYGKKVTLHSALSLLHANQDNNYVSAFFLLSSGAVSCPSLPFWSSTMTTQVKFGQWKSWI